MTVLNHPRTRRRAGALRPADLPLLPAVVDYRLGRFGGWTATLRSTENRFPTRSVHAPDAEGIYLAVLGALDAVRVETGRLIDSDHIVHDDFAVDHEEAPWCRAGA